ncbi:ubiquitin-associated-like domain-containing protein [Bacteroides sp. 519]|uniref:ubiquitin-associated-like domain-containing protein n=1 Tax=Bacteroides sp. 519 TaxID=2302937 RepID=UPI0013D78E04|nr:ubiquitin-associated-like domain-containing protein [Bacteroides sp. 519]NDV57268.1 hypothetical protein [Bacteroides sp. 519]
MEYLEEIKILRKKIPIGINQAEKLLVESAGNVAEAESRFKKNLINTFMQKQSLNTEQAVQYLEAANYDLGVAIQNFEMDTHSITKLCLLKNKNKEDALDKVLHAIHEKYAFDFWLCWEKECPQISSIEYPFVVLMEWINYESWEGDIVLSPAVVQACQVLKMNRMADILNHTINRSKEVENIWEDDMYISLNEVFLKHRSELIDTLYEYVKENMREFP